MSDDFKPSGAARAAQCSRLLEHLLKYGSITTVICRDEYGVLSPAARMLELRRAGYPIITTRSGDYDLHGRRHSCASYVLVGGTQ